MILDSIENWKLYAGLGAGIARGLELLAGGALDGLPDGRHDIDGEKLFALVQRYAPKPPEEGRWEAHRAYADIQFMVAGSEVMGYCPVAALRTDCDYDEKKDVEFFTGGLDAGTALKVGEKMFAIFFPADAHMPSLSLTALPGAAIGKSHSAGPVKKIVLKVPVAR